MKSLIIYTSKHGSTQKIVDYIAEKIQADCVNLINGTVNDLDSYDQIIIGGSVYYGSIHSLISGYIDKNLDILLNKRIALFLVCLLSEESAAEQFNNNFNENLLNHSIADGFFGGVLSKETLNPVEKLVTSFVFKKVNTFDQIYFDEIDKFILELQ